MDQLNMNNIKHHEKIIHIHKEQRATLNKKIWPTIFFQKGSMSGHVNYVGHDYILFNCTLA